MSPRLLADNAFGLILLNDRTQPTIATYFILNNNVTGYSLLCRGQFVSLDWNRILRGYTVQTMIMLT